MSPHRGGSAPTTSPSGPLLEPPLNCVLTRYAIHPPLAGIHVVPIWLRYQSASLRSISYCLTSIIKRRVVIDRPDSRNEYASLWRDARRKVPWGPAADLESARRSYGCRKAIARRKSL